MAFENLSERLQNAIKMFRGSGKITEDDLKAPLREVRMALLEADVNFKVVKDFVANIKERALGETVQQSLTPGQQIIKIVNDELTQLLGGTQSKLTVADKPPTVIMLVGLQGAGKTTTAGKLGSLLRKKGKKPLLVAGDVYRPAAIKQLQVLGEQLSLPVFALGDQVSPVEIARKAMDKAFSLACDTVIIDTAGRLHINEELMEELRNIKAAVNPHEILLVVDAMTGQDAVTVAESFNGELGIDGLIVTKLDGDARGGPSLAIRASTGVPIKLAGSGEKTEDLEVFDARRMAQRIIGMGDMEGLLEKVQSATTEADINRMTESLKKNRFTLEDMLLQLQQIQKMGPLEKVLEMLPIPGGSKALKGANVDPKRMKQTEAIILSMTLKERRSPEVIKGSRRRRIAEGSGTSVQMVNQVLAQYEQMKTMMKGIGKMSAGGKGFKMPPGMGGMGGMKNFGAGRRGFFK